MAGGMLEPLGKKNIQKLIDGLQLGADHARSATRRRVAAAGASQRGLRRQKRRQHSR